MGLFLDTNVVIDVLRGAAYARDLIRREPLLISPVTVHEVMTGMRDGEERATLGLFHGLLVAPVGRAEGELSGRWRREFAARGVTLSPQDTLIAAGAVVGATPLATANVKDFPMAELRLERWPSPPD